MFGWYNLSVRKLQLNTEHTERSNTMLTIIKTESGNFNYYENEPFVIDTYHESYISEIDCWETTLYSGDYKLLVFGKYSPKSYNGKYIAVVTGIVRDKDVYVDFIDGQEEAFIGK